MPDNFTVTNAIWTYIIPIVGLVIAAITAFGVFYGPKLVAKRQEKKEQLKTHFEGLKQNVIFKILQIISGVINDHGTLEASTLRGNRTMDDDPFPLLFGFEEMDEYQAFQVHYLEIDRTWRELITLIWKHNKDVEAALKELEETIGNSKDLPPIKPDVTPIEEKVIPATITLLFQATYYLAQGERPQWDFSKLHVRDQGEFKMLSLGNDLVAITVSEKVEQCVSALLEIQNSFRERLLGLGGNAFQLSMRLKTLAYKLKNIYDYGLISNKAGYKFVPTKDCVICKRIFY